MKAEDIGDMEDGLIEHCCEFCGDVFYDDNKDETFCSAYCCTESEKKRSRGDLK